MIRAIGVAVVVALAYLCAGCDKLSGPPAPATVLTITQTLAGACEASASGLRVATAQYRAKKLSETQARIVDNAVAVWDGFCLPGAPVPTDMRGAIQAVTVAGSNVAALNLGSK